MLGLASCQNDFDGANVGVGGEVDFQLAVAAPELGATRADDGDQQYGHDSAFGAIDYLGDEADDLRVDWKDVDLRYSLEVYDVERDYNASHVNPIKDRQVIIVDKYEPVMFELRLVPNRNYHFVVFADFVKEGEHLKEVNAGIDAQAELGIRHSIGKDLRSITLKNEAINDEVADAYFATKDIEIKNSAAQDIELKRPYGKVRVVATDLHELNLNVDPAAVRVTYDALNADGFNAVTGAISGEYETKQFVNLYNPVKKTDMNNHIYTGYNTDAYKVTSDNGVTRNKYMTIFTDYILAGADQHSIHFTMEVFQHGDSVDNLQNLIKSTSFNTDIPVQRNYLTTVIGNVLTTATEINVTIDDNFAGEIVKDIVFVSSADELQEALDAYVDGQTIIVEANIKGDVTVAQREGVDVIIEGNGYEYAGVIFVDGKSSTDTTASLTINNLKFVAESISADACIRLGNGATTTRYTRNVTIEGCTFDVPGAVGVKSYTGGDKNLTISNCVATDRAHSMLQAKGINGIFVEKCTVLSKNGLNFNNSDNVVVSECNVDVRGYAVRFGESSGGSGAAEVYTIENSTLNSSCDEAGDAVIVLRGTADNATLNLVNTTIVGNPQIINNATGSKVIVNATEGSIDFSDANYGTVTLGELKDVTIFGNENSKVIFNTTADSKLENVTLKTIEFTYDGTNVNCGIIVNAAAQIDNLVIDECTFTGNGEKKGRGLYGQNPNATITFKNCTFKNLGYPIYTMAAGGYKSLTVENCNFNLIKSWAVMAQYNDYLGDLTVTGCNFTNCTGGLVKAGKFTANHTFTFTNNTIVNSTEHPAKDWFSIDTTVAAKVVEGNTKDGAEWTPGASEGLK